jgi:putative heme-binding domain-containing protein
VFLEKVEAQCLRCHKLEGSGGDVGPAMDGIGKKYDREFLLQSIVDPSAKIAEGFENLTVTLKDGGALIGIFKGETDKELTIFSQEDGLIKIPKADIASRAAGQSGMLPGLGEVMSRRELRDLIEFLASLK